MARKTACLPKGTRISDYVTLGVLTTTVPGELIDAVLSDTGKQSRRYRQLPARLVVYYVMALVLFAQASYGEVLRCLLEGVRWLHLKGESTALAGKSAITKARIRLGIAPMRELFERVARPLAEPGLPGAWYRGRRLVSLDGTTILVPDAPELERRFGRPSSSRGPGAFPQARLLALMESGTHAIFAAAIGRYDTSEVALAPALLERLRPGMLCLADRGFVGLELWQAARAPGADLLWRVRSNQKFPCHRRLPDGSSLSRLRPSSGPRRRERAVVVRLIEYRLDGVPDAEPLYRLITSLLDPESAPAAELAALYHERWEQEGAFAELKVTLPGGHLMLRSRRADLAEQELYALLLVHLALRGLMVEASRKGGCDPDTLSFIHAVRVVRRHLPFHAAFSPSSASAHDRPDPDRDPCRPG
jgi:hypothetical protein